MTHAAVSPFSCCAFHICCNQDAARRFSTGVIPQSLDRVFRNAELFRARRKVALHLLQQLATNISADLQQTAMATTSKNLDAKVHSVVKQLRAFSAQSLMLSISTL